MKKIPIADVPSLIQLKKAAGRQRDIIDITTKLTGPRTVSPSNSTGVKRGSGAATC